jgi:hypothetical protein
MSQTFCTSCGSALPAGAAFCGACGTAVDAGPSSPPESETAPPPPPAAAAPEAPVDAPPPPSPEPVVPPPAPPAEAVYAAPPSPPPVYAAPPPPVYAAPPEPAPAYAPPSAAPLYAPAPQVAPGAPIDPEYEQRVRAFVGPNADHYLAKWRQIAAAGKPNSWNWAAFFLNAFWLAYRKMWMPALAAIGVFLLLQVVGLFSPGLRNLTSGLQLGVCAYIGWRGNAMYRAQADRALAQAGTITQDPNGQTAWLQAQGGVSLPGALGLAGGFLLIWLLLIFVIAAQMGIGRSRGSTYGSALPSSSYASPTSANSGLITHQFLAGAQWAPNCHGAGAYITLGENGYFTSSVGSGSWSLVGNVLNLGYSNGQSQEAMTLQWQGPNQFSFTEGPRSGVFNRC